MNVKWPFPGAKPARFHSFRRYIGRSVEPGISVRGQTRTPTRGRGSWVALPRVSGVSGVSGLAATAQAKTGKTEAEQGQAGGFGNAGKYNHVLRVVYRSVVQVGQLVVPSSARRTQILQPAFCQLSITRIRRRRIDFETIVGCVDVVATGRIGGAVGNCPNRQLKRRGLLFAVDCPIDLVSPIFSQKQANLV